MGYSIEDLLNIQGTDHLCKVQMKRKPEIEKEYSEYRKTFIFENLKKELFNNSETYKFCLNKFPYDIPEDMNHFVLWFNFKERNMLLGEQIINNYFKDTVIWFANIPELMSINQLFHIHIFKIIK